MKSRRMRWAGHIKRIGEKRNAYRVLVAKPEGRRPLGSPRCRWLDKIRIVLGWDDVDWIGLAEDRGRRRDLVNPALETVECPNNLVLSSIELVIILYYYNSIINNNNNNNDNMHKLYFEWKKNAICQIDSNN
jgi:hypothetical protein